MRPGNPPIALRQASKWYGQVIGLGGVDLEVGEGVIGLLGPNGSGKSTLLKLVTGLLRPSLGRVTVYGKAVWSSPRVRRLVGYCPESDTFHEDMTCREFVYSMARLSGLTRREASRRADRALEEVGMGASAEKKLGASSRGMRQRVKLAQALVHDPPVLVLDEPLLGLDPPGRRALLEAIRQLGAAGRVILFSSHILHEVEELTHRVILLDRGRVLAAGTLEEIRGWIDDQPLTVRLESDRRRALAAELLSRHAVVGLDLDGDRPREGGTGVPEEDSGEWTVRVRGARAFFKELPAAVLRAGARLERLETVDASAEAVFDYLVGQGRRRQGRPG